MAYRPSSPRSDSIILLEYSGEGNKWYLRGPRPESKSATLFIGPASVEWLQEILAAGCKAEGYSLEVKE